MRISDWSSAVFSSDLLVRDDVVLTHEAVGDRLLEPGVRGVVERLVAETADVERHPDLDVRVALRAGSTSRRRAACHAGLTALVIAGRRSDDGPVAEDRKSARTGTGVSDRVKSA